MNRRIISVVIPTYNRASTLIRSVNSVLFQTYPVDEIIIVDDCSSDNTEEIVASIDDARVKYLRHSQQLGGNAARNTGIDASSGDYIAFQDSDDEWSLSKLEI